MSAPVELHAIVSGEVQGVGFRFKAKQCADKLQLTGYAQNLPNGKVEILAQGPRHTLEDFLEMIESLSHPVKVNDVSAVWHPPQRSLTEFLVK